MKTTANAVITAKQNPGCTCVVCTCVNCTCGSSNKNGDCSCVSCNCEPACSC